MEQVDLEKMLRQMEEEARRSDEQYERWRVSVGLSTEKPVRATPKKPASPAPKEPDVTAKREPSVNREDWQVYGLRRKYCGQSEDLHLADARLPVISNWREDNPAELPTPRLHLLARRKLAERTKTDAARQALLLLTRRPQAEPCRRLFLYGYAAVQTQLSAQKLEAIVKACAQGAQERQPDGYGLHAVASMARYIASVTACAQRMREQGFRDRQEILEQAQKAAQQKLEQAQQDLNRW